MRARFISPFLISVVVLICVVSSVQGRGKQPYWQVSYGNWSNSNNWDWGEPDSGDYTYVINGGTAQVTLDGEWVRELHMGGDSTVQIESGSLSIGDQERIGMAGPARIVQTGGVHTVHQILFLGSGATGTYELSGGEYNGVREWMGFNGGAGVFIHTGGTHNVSDEMVVGFTVGATYQLGGTGLLDVSNTYVGRSNVGEFTQTGGTHIVDKLTLGDYSSGSGTYNLNGGTLTADREYIGGSGTGLFVQTGGTNNVGSLIINDLSEYEYTGGNLQINNRFDLNGTLDFGDTASVVSCGSAILNLTGANVVNADNATLNVGANSLTIYSPGVHPATLFGTFNTSGMLHEIGTTLVVGSAEGFAGAGEIDDPVDCSGTISAAAGEFINLNSGVIVRSSGDVNLGEGQLMVEDDTSQIIGGNLSANKEIVGYYGTGTFIQNGESSSNSVDSLYLGYKRDSSGSYTLNDGMLSGGMEYIGYYGSGVFTHKEGAQNTLLGNLYLGYNYRYSDGTYNMEGGTLSAEGEYIGENSTGLFTQSGGTNATNWLVVGNWTYGTGTYELVDGVLTVAVREYIGNNGGTGTFSQTGGTNQTVLLYLGFAGGSNGTYELNGVGSFSADNVYIGYRGTGTFEQSNGVSVVDGVLYLGYWNGANGTYRISGGELSIGELWIGKEGAGTFAIENQSANIVVSDKLRFGPQGVFSAVAGVEIHMTGSDFENESTDPANLAGLENLTLIFEGGSGDIDLFEVAGRDLGAVVEGWDNNFALGTLILGGADIGMLQLVDSFDNQPTWEGSEALYVNNLNIGPGSYLDLNGLNLYYMSGWVDPSATIVNGSLIAVPEPTGMVLLLVGFLFASRRR